MIDIHKPVFFLSLFLLCAATFFQAQASNALYNVEGVDVDVQAENAVKAREQAFDEAQVKAFQTLAEKLLSAEELTAFQMPEASIISSFVQDFEVTDERLSADRYKGTYIFRFHPESVQNFLSGRGVSYTDITRKPVLILPFFQYGARTILWEGQNPWLEAWARSESRNDLVPTIVPIGDLQDITQIREGQALQYDKQDLMRMESRYSAGETIIAIARFENFGNDGLLTVEVYSAEQSYPVLIDTLRIQGAQFQNMDALMNSAVFQVKNILRSDWKNKISMRSTVDQRAQNRIKAIIRYNSLQQWIDVKQRMESIAVFEEINIEALKPQKAELELTFYGGLDRLKLALQQSNLSLEPVYGSNSYGRPPYFGGGLFGGNQQQSAYYEIKPMR